MAFIPWGTPGLGGVYSADPILASTLPCLFMKMNIHSQAAFLSWEVLLWTPTFFNLSLNLAIRSS